MCNRLATVAKEQLEERRAPARVPAFYVGEDMVCEGLCDGAFERIGRGELQDELESIPTFKVVP